jgi:hypothetical protein
MQIAVAVTAVSLKIMEKIDADRVGMIYYPVYER